MSHMEPLAGAVVELRLDGMEVTVDGLEVVVGVKEDWMEELL